MPESTPSYARKFLSNLGGIGEVGLMMGTGFGTEVAGGLAGLASLPFVGAQGAGNVIDRIQNFAYQPRGSAAQRWLQTAAPHIKRVADYWDRQTTEFEQNTGIPRELTKGGLLSSLEIGGGALALKGAGTAAKQAAKLADAPILQKLEPIKLGVTPEGPKGPPLKVVGGEKDPSKRLVNKISKIHQGIKYVFEQTGTRDVRQLEETMKGRYSDRGPFHQQRVEDNLEFIQMHREMNRSAVDYLGYGDAEWKEVTHNILKYVDHNKYPSMREEYLTTLEDILDTGKKLDDLKTMELGKTPGASTKILQTKYDKLMKSKEDIELDIIMGEILSSDNPAEAYKRFLPGVEEILRNPPGGPPPAS